MPDLLARLLALLAVVAFCLALAFAMFWPG